MSSDLKRYVGQVKWFNNKAGFGFVTMKHESGVEADIFTHYTTVRVTDSQYKYLVQGEYVEFDLTESTNSKHQYQAANITGINGGNLMCETRQLNRPENQRQRQPRDRESHRSAVKDKGPREVPCCDAANKDTANKDTANKDKDESEFTKVQGKRTIQKSRNVKK